jgi:hypothetical protein
MKALHKKLLPLTLFGIAATSLFSVQPAQAFTMTLKQVGSDVVATGSGAVNLTGLTLEFTVAPEPGILAGHGVINAGQSSVNVPAYGGFSGPTTFGSGGSFFPNTSSGDFVGINNSFGTIFVPAGYVSDTALSDNMTFNSATFASLGVTPGTYVWSWGDGANQRFTLRIGAVPDGGSTVSLLGFALLGLAALRRKLSC